MLHYRRLSQTYTEACVLAGVRWVGNRQRYYVLLNDQGQVENWCPTLLWDDVPIVNLKGAWLSPGGFDLQINGALGVAFNNLYSSDLPRLAEISHWLYNQGIDAILPTLITTDAEALTRSLDVLAHFPNQGAQSWGVHLEGPFLNPQKPGVHPTDAFLPLDRDHVEPFLSPAPIALITLAPEQTRDPALFRWLRQQGVRVSLGHTLATAAEASVAFEWGADLVTHLFNAMPPLHHREPGVVGVALTNPNVWCSLIADGQHVHPTVVQIVLQATPRAIVVSDALAPLGLPDATYPWLADQTITVSKGTARLSDGTLAGTTQPLLEAVRKLVTWGVCDLPSAIALVCLNPYRWFHSDPSWGHVPRLGDLMLWQE